MDGILKTFWIMFVLWTPRLTSALDKDDCNTALGMETGEIMDRALSASSQLGGPGSQVSAQQGRIRGRSAWCPDGNIDKDSHEYLEIDFGGMKVLTLIETQGNFGNGKGQEYADQYKLEYQRETNGRWFTFKNKRGREIFHGNMNTYIPELREIDPPIITRRLRVVPYSEESKSVCMRVELYGCTWQDRLVAYSIPQGETRGSEIDLVDFTYDGDENNGQLIGGLGQLTDGVQGESNYRTTDETRGIKGYDWVGWRNETFGPDPLVLLFKFDSVRNFTSMRLFTNNLFSRDVRVFRKAVIHSSIGGNYYTTEPIRFNYMRDTIMEYARPVTISLNNHIGQYLKVQLYFDSKWMMISEVQFESLSAAGVFPVESPPDILPGPDPSSTSPGAANLPSDTSEVKDTVFVTPTSDKGQGVKDGKNVGALPGYENEDKDSIRNDEGVETKVGKTEKIPDGGKTNEGGDVPRSTTESSVIAAPHDQGGLGEEHIGIIVGALVALFIIIAVIVFFIVMRSRKKKYRSRTYLQAQNSTFEDLRSGTLKSSKSSNGNLYNFVATSDVDSERGLTTCCTNNANTSSVYGDISDGSVHTRKYPEFPKTPDSTYSSNRDYAVPDIMQSAVMANGTNSAFVYSPNQCGLGTISGSICAAPFANVPPGVYTNNNKIGPNGATQPPRLPVPPPPPYPVSAEPYASSDLVTLQAPTNSFQPRSAAPVTSNSNMINTQGGLRSSTPVGLLHHGAIVQGAPMSRNTPPPPPPSSATNPLFQTLPKSNIQGVSGTNVYSMPTPDSDEMWAEELAVMEFPRDSLKYLDKIGEGQFGEVHLCLAQNLEDLLGGDFLVNRTGPSQDMLVAVKMLKPMAEQQARENFKQEAKIMSRLKDPNIVQVLGVCSRGNPLCVIVEYMKHGDLNQFLQKHALEGTKTVRRNVKTLSYGCLTYMATEIASGMKYLETQNLVHRDLAARNCLVGSYYTIKISDFGMSRGLYSSDYYKIEGRAMLPIRWMAWESVILGKFSSKSDVWSFAVTLWEVLNFCREQPFADMSDELVIQNCSHYYNNTGQELYLPMPKHCPKEIYDLMCECWNPEESLRPSFREIHMFLQRKNMGYDPKDECPESMSEGSNESFVV